MPALEILAAALLTFGSILVFRALVEADRLHDSALPGEAYEPPVEETPPLRQAA